MEKLFLRARERARAGRYGEGLPARAHALPTPLTLMSPSNFHKTHAFLRVTNTCHCLVSDDDLHQHTTYRISLSLLLSYQTYPEAAWLASLLPQSPLHTPPASAAPLPRKLPTMCLVPRRPPEKETLVWRLLAFAPPFSGIYIYLVLSSGKWTFLIKHSRMSSGVIVATPAPGAAVTKSTTLSGTVSYPQSSIPSLMRPATPLGTQQVEVPARPAAPSSKDANSKRSHSLSQEVAKHNSTRSDEGSRRSSPRSHGSPRSGKSPRSKTAQATQQASPTSKSTVSASRSRRLVSEDPEAPWDVPYSVRTQVAQAGGSSPRRHSPVATATGTAGPQASQGSSRPPGPTEIGQGPVAHPVAAGPSSPIPPPRSESQKRRYHDLYEDHEIRLRKWQAKTEEKKRKEEEEVQKNIATTRSPRNFNEDRFQSWQDSQKVWLCLAY